MDIPTSGLQAGGPWQSEFRWHLLSRTGDRKCKTRTATTFAIRPVGAAVACEPS